MSMGHMAGYSFPEKFYKLLYLIKCGKEIDSKTKLQKIVFLLKEEYGLDLGFKFIRYNYGPYSHDLTETLESMKTLEIVEKTVVLLGGGDIFPAKQIKYRLTEKGAKVLEGSSISKSDKGKIRKVVADWNGKNREEIVTYVYDKYMGKDEKLQPAA